MTQHSSIERHARALSQSQRLSKVLLWLRVFLVAFAVRGMFDNTPFGIWCAIFAVGGGLILEIFSHRFGMARLKNLRASVYALARLNPEAVPVFKPWHGSRRAALESLAFTALAGGLYCLAIDRIFLLGFCVLGSAVYAICSIAESKLYNQENKRLIEQAKKGEIQ